MTSSQFIPSSSYSSSSSSLTLSSTFEDEINVGFDEVTVKIKELNKFYSDEKRFLFQPVTVFDERDLNLLGSSSSVWLISIFLEIQNDFISPYFLIQLTHLFDFPNSSMFLNNDLLLSLICFTSSFVPDAA